MRNQRISINTCCLKKSRRKIPSRNFFRAFWTHRPQVTFYFFKKTTKSFDVPDRDSPDQTKVFFRRHGFRAWARTFSPPTFGLHSVTSLFVSEKRGAKSSLFWTRTYNFWGNACMKGENDFVTIWTNPTEPVLKLCFRAVGALLVIGVSPWV